MGDLLPSPVPLDFCSDRQVSRAPGCLHSRCLSRPGKWIIPKQRRLFGNRARWFLARYSVLTNLIAAPVKLLSFDLHKKFFLPVDYQFMALPCAKGLGPPWQHRMEPVPILGAEVTPR